jgi:hypothetical protein
MENSEAYQFIACDYYATGEGRTICLLITRAYPKPDDYEVVPTFTKDDDGKIVHVPGVLKHSRKLIAAREFSERFGKFLTQGAVNLSREDFFNRFSRLIPDMTVKLLNSKDTPGNFYFAQEFHFNYS